MCRIILLEDDVLENDKNVNLKTIDCFPYILSYIKLRKVVKRDFSINV